MQTIRSVLGTGQFAGQPEMPGKDTGYRSNWNLLPMGRSHELVMVPAGAQQLWSL